MKAITLTQPWATLVAIGAKNIETRGWRTSYRGPLAIHAAKGMPRLAMETCFTKPFRGVLARAGFDFAKELPRGYVLATCELTAVHPTEDLICLPNIFWERRDLDTPQERAFGDYSEDRWAWVLEDVKMLPEPIPARGALSLWNWEPAHDSR